MQFHFFLGIDFRSLLPLFMEVITLNFRVRDCCQGIVQLLDDARLFDYSEMKAHGLKKYCAKTSVDWFGNLTTK